MIFHVAMRLREVHFYGHPYSIELVKESDKLYFKIFVAESLGSSALELMNVE